MALDRGRPRHARPRRCRRGPHRHAQAVQPPAGAAAARPLRQPAPRARVARHPLAAPHRGRRARLAAQRRAGHLRADPPLAAVGAAGQRRRQGRRRRVVPRRARHPLLAPPRSAPVEEARALDRRCRAGRDDTPLRARHRRDRAAVDPAARRAPAEDAAPRAALGEEGRAGGRARAGHALRARRLQQPARRLRPRRPEGGARDLHPRGAGRRAHRGRLRDEAAVLRAQPAPDPRGAGARAQGAAPGRAGRRRADLRLLRPAAAAGRVLGRDARALVP